MPTAVLAQTSPGVVPPVNRRRKTFTAEDTTAVIKRLAESLVADDCHFDPSGLNPLALQAFIDAVQSNHFPDQLTLVNRLRGYVLEISSHMVIPLVNGIKKGHPLSGFRRRSTSNRLEVIIFTGDPSNLLYVESTYAIRTDPRA